MRQREKTNSEHWAVKVAFALVLTCLVGAEIALYSGCCASKLAVGTIATNVGAANDYSTTTRVPTVTLL